MCCEAHKAIEQHTVEMLTLISFDICEVWQSHFALLDIKDFKRWHPSSRLSNMPVKKTADILPPDRCYDCIPFKTQSLYPLSCCHAAPSQIWVWPCQRRESDWAEWEVRIGNHLLAKGTDGTNTSKMFMQQQSKKSSLQADSQTNRNTSNLTKMR